MKTLALLGGTPTRTAPFASSVVVDARERELIADVLDHGEFSRFMGSPTEDIEQLLAMASEAAYAYKTQYFTFLGGRMVRRFERDFARKMGVPFAISVNSATSGLTTALAAAGCGPGHEVITTCLSFNATALAVLGFNSVPIFVDVSENNFCLDPSLVEAAVTKRTRAILVVHLLGFPADMDAILDIARRHDLKVIEDCAQAPGTLYKGRPVGTIGDAGVFSFQETKNMMTGEGGMILTTDPAMARRCRLIRNHGESVPDNSWSTEELDNLVGQNFRMTELTAALGVAQLEKLDGNNARRRENARRLQDGVAGLPGLTAIPFPEGAVPHILPFLYDAAVTQVERDDVLRALRAEGIPVGSGYVRLMPENPLFQKKTAYGQGGCPWSCHLYGLEPDYGVENFPVAKRLIGERFLWFYHIHAPNGPADMDQAAAAFRKVFGNLDQLRAGSFEKKKLGYKW
ncbi:MAG: DegT/DnrJ/EryC1/StrS family aminotransferase [Thermodesulfobacteriota bacterium]